MKITSTVALLGAVTPAVTSYAVLGNVPPRPTVVSGLRSNNNGRPTRVDVTNQSPAATLLKLHDGLKNGNPVILTSNQGPGQVFLGSLGGSGGGPFGPGSRLRYSIFNN